MDLVVARVAEDGYIVVIAYAIVAASPFDQFEKQSVGDRSHGFGLACGTSAEGSCSDMEPEQSMAMKKAVRWLRVMLCVYMFFGS